MERRMMALRRGLLLATLVAAGLAAGCSAPQAGGAGSAGAAKYQGYVEVGGQVRL
jgi:hypothetical protein